MLEISQVLSSVECNMNDVALLLLPSITDHMNKLLLPGKLHFFSFRKHLVCCPTHLPAPLPQSNPDALLIFLHLCHRAILMLAHTTEGGRYCVLDSKASIQHSNQTGAISL